MKRAQFQDRLDLYGADLTAWPEDDRARAAELLSRDPEARQALARARVLDDLVQASLKSQHFESRADVVVSRALLGLRPLPAQDSPPAEPRFGLAHLAALGMGSARLTRVAALASAAVLGAIIGYAGAERHALEDKRSMSVSIDDMESEL